MSRYLILSTLLFCALINTRVSQAAPSFDPAPCQQQHCMAVIDVGSTGSRLHVYAYDIDPLQTPSNPHALWTNKLAPGFASLASDQKTIDSYLTGLFAGMPIDIPIPTYFYATAGMRSQPPTKQALYYTRVKHWFSEHPQWPLIDARTITGKEEGVFGWLAVNFTLGTLADETKIPVGVLDIGGASVEIAFPIQSDERIDPQDIASFQWSGRPIRLFVHSFLGLGQTEVLNQYLDDPRCFSTDYTMPNGSLATGNGYACQQAITPLINEVHQVNKTLQPAFTSNKVDRWYAIGALVNLMESEPFKLKTKNASLTNEQLLEQAQSTICSQPWDQLVNQYPSDDYLYLYCFAPAYYYALIVNGYQISPTTPIHSLPSTQTSDWTLGVVLHPL